MEASILRYCHGTQSSASWSRQIGNSCDFSFRIAIMSGAMNIDLNNPRVAISWKEKELAEDALKTAVSDIF